MCVSIIMCYIYMKTGIDIVIDNHSEVLVLCV